MRKNPTLKTNNLASMIKNHSNKKPWLFINIGFVPYKPLKIHTMYLLHILLVKYSNHFLQWAVFQSKKQSNRVISFLLLNVFYSILLPKRY